MLCRRALLSSGSWRLSRGCGYSRSTWSPPLTPRQGSSLPDRSRCRRSGQDHVPARLNSFQPPAARAGRAARVASSSVLASAVFTPPVRSWVRSSLGTAETVTKKRSGAIWVIFAQILIGRHSRIIARAEGTSKTPAAGPWRFRFDLPLHCRPRSAALFGVVRSRVGVGTHRRGVTRAARGLIAGRGGRSACCSAEAGGRGGVDRALRSRGRRGGHRVRLGARARRPAGSGCSSWPLVRRALRRLADGGLLRGDALAGARLDASSTGVLTATLGAALSTPAPVLATVAGEGGLDSVTLEAFGAI